MQFCNLGSSMTSLDINNDGKDDLVIGSPFASVKNLTQNGMVTALLSSNSLGKILFEEFTQSHFYMHSLKKHAE